MDHQSATTADCLDNHIAYMVTRGLNVRICRYNDSWKILHKAAQAVLTDQATNCHLIQKVESTQLRTPQIHNPVLVGNIQD